MVRHEAIKHIEARHLEVQGTETEHQPVFEQHRELRATEVQEVVPVARGLEVQAHVAANHTEVLRQVEVPTALQEVAVQVREAVVLEVLEVVQEVQGVFEVLVARHVHLVHDHQEEEAVVVDSKSKLKISKNLI